MSSKNSNHIKSILSQYWGYTTFKPLQEEIIHAVLQKKDTIAVLPTGGGKSMCYQLPGLYFDGICIVITPLIALMQEQVKELNSKGIKAVAIHGGLKTREIDILLDNCIYGDISFLFLSPERLKSITVTTRLKKMNVSLFAIDEAHCISQWGFDFRPSYLEVKKIRENISEAPIIALTATATKKVVKDISEQLQLDKPQIFRGSFYRENITYHHQKCLDKQDELLALLKTEKENGIIYLRNRKKCELLAKWLHKEGYSVAFYHAGLSPKDRQTIQNNWMKGKIKIIVSTNAFGMGINKTDLNWVVHFDLPASVEDYYQESGRVGRDGSEANAYLLWNDKDIDLLKFHFEAGYPSMDIIRKVYQTIINQFQLASGDYSEKGFPFDVYKISKNSGVSPIIVFNTVKLIEKAGYWFLTETELDVSKLQIIMHHRSLDKYLEHHPVFETLIKTCLRSYSGLFNGAQQIHEEEIAERIGWVTEEVVQRLQKLDQQEVIHYQRKNFLPHLVFLQNRVKTRNLSIPKNIYADRKKLDAEKLKNMMDFVKEENHCKQRMLCGYFEERLNQPCGKCSNCMKKHQSKDFSKEINYPILYKEISKKYGPQSQTILQIRFLIEEGILYLKEGIIYKKD